MKTSIVRVRKPRNPFEKSGYSQLKRDKVSFGYETERIPYTLHRYYIPDFIITTKKGHKIYVEFKGYLRPNDRCKLVAVLLQHPDLDLRLVFFERRQSQIRWAEKLGIQWAIRKIPREWYNED